MIDFDHGQTPKMRPLPQRRTAIVAALDIGTTKVACLIAKLTPCAANDVLRGRTHAVEVMGVSHIQSRGIKAGAVVDLEAAEQAVRRAVSLAETKAGVQVEGVILSVSAGRIDSQLMEASADIHQGAVAPHDMSRIMSACTHHAASGGRSVLHALPSDFNVDGVKGVRNPRGMVARQVGVEITTVTSDVAATKNLMLAVERCHLSVEAMVASPYAAGLSLLADDEADLGAAVIDMGGGTTTLSTYAGGRLVYASGFAVGGQHVTMDLARGLSACIADAERIKTLYGTVLPGGADARELLTVPSTGGHDEEPPHIVSRGTIANIARQRVEEIFEMVRDRLANSPLANEPRGRIVLAGGASLLTGTPELAGRILNRPVRVGRPLGIARLPEAAKGPSFAVAAGLLIYPQFAHLEHVEPRHTRHLMTGTDGYIGKVGRWLRESF